MTRLYVGSMAKYPQNIQPRGRCHTLRDSVKDWAVFKEILGVLTPCLPDRGRDDAPHHPQGLPPPMYDVITRGEGRLFMSKQQRGPIPVDPDFRGPVGGVLTPADSGRLRPNRPAQPSPPLSSPPVFSPPPIPSRDPFIRCSVWR